MEGTGGAPVPDLQSVLATLARLAPKNQAPPVAVPQPHLGIPAQAPQIPAYDPRKAHEARTETLSLTDPATIIEWSQGLRCVTKMSARNSDFRLHIRRLIHEQHKHEKQWWEGRVEILKKYTGPYQGDAEERRREQVKELEEYDRKVYGASKEMVLAMESELKHLGVPFFGTKPELILPKERVVLQRKMLQYLEDMYRD